MTITHSLRALGAGMSLLLLGACATTQRTRYQDTAPPLRSS